MTELKTAAVAPSAPAPAATAAAGVTTGSTIGGDKKIGRDGVELKKVEERQERWIRLT